MTMALPNACILLLCGLCALVSTVACNGIGCTELDCGLQTVAFVTPGQSGSVFGAGDIVSIGADFAQPVKCVVTGSGCVINGFTVTLEGKGSSLRVTSSTECNCIDLEVSRGGTVLYHRSQKLFHIEQFPNGEACGPTCRQVSERVDVATCKP